MKKAQVFTPDFIVASIMFLLILTILQVYTQNMYEKIDKQENLLYYDSLISTTDILLLYQGYPEYWNENNVEVLGVAKKPNYLNRTKVEHMMNMTNDKIRKIINIEGRSFNMTIENSTDIMYTKGSSDWGNAENIFVINRNGIMDERSVKIRFIVW